MDVTAKVEALEEEITVLKGEIKSILQEVRAAVLARDNPFAAGPQDHAAAPTPWPAEPVQAIRPPETDTPPSAPEPLVIEKAERPSPMPAVGQSPVALHQQLDRPSALRRRWSMQTLATLMSWTQETAERLSESDFDVVLSLARYGGLVDEELEGTLNRLASTLDRPQEARKAGTNDYLLALRQLDAVLGEEDEGTNADQSVRRAG